MFYRSLCVRIRRIRNCLVVRGLCSRGSCNGTQAAALGHSQCNPNRFVIRGSVHLHVGINRGWQGNLADLLKYWGAIGLPGFALTFPVLPNNVAIRTSEFGKGLEDFLSFLGKLPVLIEQEPNKDATPL